jgi:hypothetical protein
MYLTHYGRVGDAARLADRFLQGLDDMVAIAERHAESTERHQRIRADYTALLVQGARSHGVELPEDRLLELLDNDIGLNTHGLEIWLDRR